LVFIVNVGTSPLQLELLAQIPQGSIPLGNPATISNNITVAPFSTSSVNFSFYFPKAGVFSWYPAHISENGSIIGCGVPKQFNVQTTPELKTDSWSFIATQQSEQILNYLQTLPVHSEKLNWRLISSKLLNKDFYEQALQRMEQRLFFSPELWAWSFYHLDFPRMAEYLARDNHFAKVSGWFSAMILNYDPFSTGDFLHREYGKWY
jgi:hypothetical protein